MKKLKYIGDVSDEQINWGHHTDPRNLLKENEVYEVVHEEVCSWHTKIFLKGFESNYFNSVWFEEIK